MNTIPNKVLTNAQLKTIVEHIKLDEVGQSIDIESIVDHHTKIIFRTILGSIEALYEHLESSVKTK